MNKKEGYLSEKQSESVWAIGIYKSSSSPEPFNFIGDDVSNPILTVSNITDVKI